MLPNFFVIGAAKSGTSSLHSYLGLHPEIHMSRVKEPNFFVPEDALARLWGIPEDALALLWEGQRDARQDEMSWAAGLSRLDYEALFEPARIRGESSVHYSMYPAIRGVPERITGLIPDARFIYIVRDPIERIRSQYLQLAKSTAQPSLDDALGDLDDPGNRLMCPSRYMTQVNRYLAVAPSERILVVDFARLRDQRRSELARIFSFLSVDPAYRCDGFTEKHHVTANHRDRSRARRLLSHKTVRSMAHSVPHRIVPSAVRLRMERAITQSLSRRALPDPPDVTPELRAELTRRLEPEVKRLQEFTGQAFVSWSM